jgi:hypothetical protein
MAFLQAILAGHRRLIRAIFGNVPFLVAMLARSSLDVWVNAVGLSVADPLLVQGYFTEETMANTYPSSPQLKHLIPKPTPSPSRLP